MLLWIESVERASAQELICLVRCMEGPVKLGDLFDTVEVEEGEVAVSLRITRIDRYEGVSVEFFEPPHIAKIFMTGTGAEAVTQYARLRG